MEINVLQILDKMDKFRREHQNEKTSPADYCMRVLEAIVAEAAGYTERNEWTEILKADKSTEYSKDLS